ncbi:hypothetical protein LUZ63_024291 [Rhynchospora breviuscula]|uniref:Beta-ketoadipyl CoA thiolase n=1 Tax=Rhynchospora breviuscula TaxID=2022672 RepID=A0A9P9Z1F8_9POAL|nr:hypothetical protein LUZ63_024291 [Rhynchospora breviuscula]
MAAIVERTSLDPARIDDVIFGDANQAGEDNRNVARFGALLAGLPTTVTGTTVNRLCASSVEAVIQASRAVEAGDADIVLAGGVESMSRAPYVVEKSPKPFPAVGNPTMWNTAIGWRMTNRALPTPWTISNGESAEKIAREWGITREQQDAFAVRSHRLAASAWAGGGLRRRDRAGARGRSRARRGYPRRHLGALDAEPLARIAGRAAHGVDPDVFPIAPIEAANKALARAGKTWADVDFVELNEAFASQSLACLAGWPDLDPEKLNVHGGALAIGHPLGASGGRIIGHAAHELARRGSGVAVAAICIGVGQGLAVVLER